jgi:hypothetical protein
MPGSFDLSPVPGGQATQALPIIVALYEPGEDGGSYTILPNVRCQRIDYREGPEPPLARFQYFMDNLLDATLGWPSQFERLWPMDAQGDYVVMTDDCLVVLTQDPDGNPLVLFDGFAQIPQCDVAASQQAVSFVAQGVAVRLWDVPITGRIQRDASPSGLTTLDGSADVRCGLPARFNPADTGIGTEGGYRGNATTDPTTDDDAGEEGGSTYPVFVDPLVNERGDFDASFWYVSDALSYLIVAEGTNLDGAGNPYVVYPTISSLKDLLSCEAPPDDGLLNSGDATPTDVNIRDYDASNKAVPDVFAELLRYCGFVMTYFTDTTAGGSPQTRLKIIRKDGLATQVPKLLYLAPEGASLDMAASNTTAIHLARDLNELVNQWTVETSLQQVEISVLLAPLFQPSPADATDPKPFFSSNLTNATNEERRMYRWFGADECGDGYWNLADSVWVTDHPLDLSEIFPNDDDDNFTYMYRYRPGSRTLISKDKNGKPLKAVLEILPNVASGDPALGDPEDGETWITIPSGWRLLDDRLGIEVTGDNPDHWTTGAGPRTDGQATLKHIRTIKWTNGTTDAQPFTLRLTTVIDADQRIPADRVTAEKRPASPTQFTRERSADGKDHFQYCTIEPSSFYYGTQKDVNGDPSDGTNALVCRDDAKAAKTHAEQLRSAHEFPTLAGSATLSFITDYYQIGDRVKIIQGRNANLQINVGVDQGEAPTYPWVTAFAWDFQGDKQQTMIQFSDRRAEPQGV